MKNLKEIIKENQIKTADCCNNAGAVSGAVEAFIKENSLNLEFVRPISRKYNPAYGFDFRKTEEKKDGTKILFFDENKLLKKEVFISVVENGLLHPFKKVGDWKFSKNSLEIF